MQLRSQNTFILGTINLFLIITSKIINKQKDWAFSQIYRLQKQLFTCLSLKMDLKTTQEEVVFFIISLFATVWVTVCVKYSAL